MRQLAWLIFFIYFVIVFILLSTNPGNPFRLTATAFLAIVIGDFFIILQFLFQKYLISIFNIGLRYYLWCIVNSFCKELEEEEENQLARRKFRIKSISDERKFTTEATITNDLNNDAIKKAYNRQATFEYLKPISSIDVL